MKVLAFNGSPRKGGNTEILLRAALAPAEEAGMETELIQARMNDNLFSRKIGAAVVAQRRGGAVNVLDAINHMFLMSRMIVPGSTYWNFGVGLAQGDVANDKEALENMRDLGETIVWLVQTLHAPAAPIE